MNEADIKRYIIDTFAGITVTELDGNTYFFCDPDQKFTFATLVTNNLIDQASDLDLPSVYRLNMGVGKGTYESLFGPRPSWGEDGGPVNTGHDFTVLDEFLPHPIYAPMGWICVLNPSEATFQRARAYLDEAYRLDVQKYAKRKERG